MNKAAWGLLVVQAGRWVVVNQDGFHLFEASKLLIFLTECADLLFFFSRYFQTKRVFGRGNSVADFRGGISAEKATKRVPLLVCYKNCGGTHRPISKKNQGGVSKMPSNAWGCGCGFSGFDVHQAHVIRNFLIPTKLPVPWKPVFSEKSKDKSRSSRCQF